MIIKGFLTEEECNAFLSEVEGNPDWKPQSKDTGIYILKSRNHKLLVNIYKRVSELFESTLHAQIIRLIHKTDKASIWARHSDNAGGSEIKYGVVIYLNDNFEGGELYYPSLGLTIKPEKGMLVYHPGDEDHEVLKVVAGERYTLTSFIRSQGKK